ncbi:hypothetical protein ES708_13297 [subsurface metagenome]
MRYVIPEQLPVQELKEGIEHRVAWGKNVMISMLEMAPATAIPEHSHPHEQVGEIISGSVQVIIAGEAKILEVGHIYFVSPGEKHSLRALESGAVIRDFFTPIREEFRSPQGTEERYFPR